MDPVPTFPLPNLPPVDLGDLIARTNGAAHAMMPYVEGFYSTLEQRTAAAEAALKTAGQPLIRSLRARTNGVVKRMTAAAAPVADMLAERTAAAQRGMLDFPVPVASPTSLYWTLVDSSTCEARVVPAEPGYPPTVAEPVRAYGPYRTDAQAQQAIATYRVYLKSQGLCSGGPTAPPAGAPPTLDWYWVD